MSNFYPWTLNVRPLAVFLSFSSFSGLALLSTVCYSANSPGKPSVWDLTLKEISRSPSHPRVDVGL